MATFESTYTHTFTVPVSLAVARDHFANPEVIIAHTQDVETATVEGDTIHFVMKAQEHMGISTFQPDYRSTYTVSGDVIRWAPKGEANTRQSGSATFTARGDETEVVYSESVAIDMDVPKLMAPMLKPVIGAVLSHEIKEFTARMRKTLDSLKA